MKKMLVTLILSSMFSTLAIADCSVKLKSYNASALGNNIEMIEGLISESLTSKGYQVVKGDSAAYAVTLDFAILLDNSSLEIAKSEIILKNSQSNEKIVHVVAKNGIFKKKSSEVILEEAINNFASRLPQCN